MQRKCVVAFVADIRVGASRQQQIDDPRGTSFVTACVDIDLLLKSGRGSHRSLVG